MIGPFDKIAVPTTAGTYVIELHYDTDALVPDYSDDGGFVYLGNSRTISAGNGDRAHEVAALIRAHTAHNEDLWPHQCRSAAAIARYVHLTYGLPGVLEVSRCGDTYTAAEPSTDRYGAVDGLAWAPADATWPERYTRGTVAAYNAWANGEVYGYVVKGPDDLEVDSCWDFYADADQPLGSHDHHGLGHMISQAHVAVDGDVEARTAAANTAGAGFRGII
jgi:hypothetical protein